MKENLLDKSSLVFTLFIFVFSLIFIYSNSAEFFRSLTAALLIALLGFSAFIIIRIVYLAFRR